MTAEVAEWIEERGIELQREGKFPPLDCYLAGSAIFAGPTGLASLRLPKGRMERSEMYRKVGYSHAGGCIAVSQWPRMSWP